MADRALGIEGVTVRFGGAVAVDNVSLHAPPGQVTSLIGPNGAGKTTIFNVCSGLQRADGGRVTFGDRDLTALPPQQRARAGLGRTFQRMQLFENLTVEQNVALGFEARMAGRNAWRHLRSPRSIAARTRVVTAEACAACGIESIARRLVRNLSTGQRRLVELARVIAGEFDLLLLDEPSSGLDHSETHQFGAILRSLVAQRGVGILLVEHDMDLVMSVSANVFVLEFGRLIAEGAPASVQSDPRVREAYLGTAS